LIVEGSGVGIKDRNTILRRKPHLAVVIFDSSRADAAVAFHIDHSIDFAVGNRCDRSTKPGRNLV
jgi:hypothetical protein